MSRSRTQLPAVYAAHLFLFFALLGLPCVLDAAETTPSTEARRSSRRSANADTSADPFDPFRVIAEKNIFNPNRTPRVVRGGSTSSETPTGPSDEVIALVGTMRYEKGPFAFFDGSDYKYRKAVAEGSRIASFTVKSVTAQTIDLTEADRTITLRVGEQLRRRPGGEWTVTTTPVHVAAAAAPSASTDTSSRPSPTIPANASETLRRLMEQRKKQLEK